jgi:hypothetical protein
MHAFAERPKASRSTVLSATRTSSDRSEREADHAADHVTRLPASTLQRAHQVGERSPTEAPAIVHDVVRTPGRPLDAQTRGFMEPRFGHDFSQVRVHSDASAAESARAVDALAYTFGKHVVFGAGRYVPATGEGRWLLAHELAHVVQQADASTLQRKPDGDAAAKARQETRLEELARDPAKAHDAWKTLTTTERDGVTERMRRRYGEPFAQQFLDVVKKGKPQFDVDYYQPGVGPTREQLLARGYRQAGFEHTGNAAFEVELWVHPVGKTVRRDVSTWKFGASGPGTKGGGGAGKSPAKQPPVVEPPTEPPVTTTARHEQALDFLEEMNTSNTKLQSLCEANPFDLSAAEYAEREWNDAREALRDFQDLDWTGIDPDFWSEVSESRDENLDLRAACCKRAPKSFWFDCDSLPKPSTP